MSKATSGTSLEGIVNPAYIIKKLDIKDAEGGRYIAGYANVAGVRDNQGDIVTLEALQKAWEKWRANPDYCILSFLHSNIPLAKVIFDPVTDSEGRVHQSGVDETGLYLVSQVRGDTTIADEMWHKIEQQEYRGYSIAGKNLKPQPRVCEHGTCTTNIVDFELYEVAIVDNPANKFSLFNVLKRDDLAKLSEVTNPIKNAIITEGVVKISKKPCPDGGHYHVIVNAKGELYEKLAKEFTRDGMVVIEGEREDEEYVNLFNLARLRPYTGLTEEEQHGGFNSPPLQDKPKTEGETPLEKEDVKEEKKEESPKDDSEIPETPKVEEKEGEKEAIVPPTVETLAAELATLKQIIADMGKVDEPIKEIILEPAPVAQVPPVAVASQAETIPVEVAAETVEASPAEIKPVDVKPDAPIETRGVNTQEKPTVGLDLASIHENVSWKDIQNQEPRRI